MISLPMNLQTSLDAAKWPQLEPHYQELERRAVASSGDLERLILDRSELDAAADEAQANLYIEMTCHTDDAGRRTAFLDFVQDVEPKLKVAGAALDRKIIECPFVKDLSATRYDTYLRALRQEARLFRQENVPLQTEATTLEQEYSRICGEMTVEFDGREQTMPQMAKYLESTLRDQREASWCVVTARRLRDREAIDAIFDKLVAVRHTMALNAGFKNFRDYQHERLHRFDYTPADCLRFHEAIERTCVPLMRDLQSERANALAIPTVRPWDGKVDLRGRAPLRPFADTAQLVERTSRAFHRLDAELGQLFDSMRTGACLDLETRKGKAPGGYQYQRQRSRTPFIFMNAAGLQRDLVTMVHEAGHAFHSLLSKHDPLLAYRGSPIEFAEVASMSMELLTFPQLDEFYTEEESARARRDLLEGLATLLPWVASIDAFQHWVYTNPGHSRAERAAHWMTIHQRFGGGVDYTGHEDSLASLWQRQLHLFGSPFYYVEYGIAQLGALQIWAQARRDPAAALCNYKRALALGGSQPLPELFKSAGISFDFGPETVSGLMDEVQAELETIPA
ncbi:MAG: M3 family oligoendopeptidase [Phycisphaerales bacterium]|nr:M3 family oligoendopeptidase [Phycisphaerales bacterium]